MNSNTFCKAFCGISAVALLLSPAIAFSDGSSEEVDIQGGMATILPAASLELQNLNDVPIEVEWKFNGESGRVPIAANQKTSDPVKLPRGTGTVALAAESPTKIDEYKPWKGMYTVKLGETQTIPITLDKEPKPLPTLAVKNPLPFAVVVSVPTAKGATASRLISANAEDNFDDIPVGQAFNVVFKPSVDGYAEQRQNVDPLGWGKTASLTISLTQKATPPLAVKNTMSFAVDVTINSGGTVVASRRSLQAGAEHPFADLPADKALEVVFTPSVDGYAEQRQNVGPLDWGKTASIEIRLDREISLGELAAEVFNATLDKLSEQHINEWNPETDEGIIQLLAAGFHFSNEVEKMQASAAYSPPLKIAAGRLSKILDKLRNESEDDLRNRARSLADKIPDSSGNAKFKLWLKNDPKADLQQREAFIPQQIAAPLDVPPRTSSRSTTSETTTTSTHSTSTTSTSTTTSTSIPTASPAAYSTTSTTATASISIPTAASAASPTTTTTTTTSIPPLESDGDGEASWLWIVTTLSVFIAGVAAWPLLRRAVAAWRRFEENGIVRYSFGTWIGSKEVNEDVGWVGDVRLADGRTAFLACVADGVSGGVDGDKVAAMSVAAVRTALGKACGECFASEESVRDWCRGWAAQLQRDVFAKHPDGYSTLCAYIEISGSWFVLSVGDSRIFWIPDSGEGSICLTKKHLQSITMLKNGVPEERAGDYAHALVRAVGLPVGAGEELLDVGRVEPFRRGWVVVGTDGIFDILTSSYLWKMARTTHLAFRFVRKILKATAADVNADGFSAGAYRDNATVAVRRID